jgi:pyruvate,water dikinase
LGLVRLRSLGLAVPRFVVVTSRVFDDTVERARALEPLLAGLDTAEWDALVEASRRISDRIRASGCPAELRAELQGALEERGLAETRLAVRSSAVGEDSARHSFAGVMESRLNVTAEGLSDALVDVWVSAFSARALAYRQRKGLTLRHVRTAVIVQEMVPAVSAGVLFTLDPGRRGSAGGRRTVARASSVIVAGWGLGEGVVQGSVDTDTYRFDEDGGVVRGAVGPKTSRVVPSESGGTHDEAVPESLRRRSVLADDQVRRLADVGVAIERALGTPQDVEWAFDAFGRLLVLQARPILRPEPSPRINEPAATNDDHRVWDNSNIVESYPGLTLPLTFSFVRNAYAQAFRRACAAFFPLANPLEARPHLFANLLGLLDGRVYYNLLNWYEMFSYLARPERHRKTWDRMVGVRDGAPAVAPESVRPLRVRVTAALGALRVLLGIRRIARRFARLFEEFYQRRRGVSEPTSPMGLAIRYRVIEQEAARFWHLTLFIDLCAMRYHEWLAALVARWLPGHDALADRLLAGEEGVESVAPARSLGALVERVRAEPRWRERFVEGDDAQLWRALHRETSLAPLREAIEEHVDRFGDRGIEELKLETITFREEPRRLLGVIRRALDAGAGSSVETRRELPRERRREAQAVVARRLGGLRRLVFQVVLGRAREAIRSRENMRFARSRLFGLVRGVFRRLAETLVEAGVLADPSDVFYLTTDEALGHVEGTALTRDLQALVTLRRGEYAEFARRSPADRVETTGLPGLSSLPLVEREPADGRRLEGIGCSAGAVTGVAHVVRDPAGASVRRDQVLVARSTDPGWVFLMMSAAGLVAERGSPLSHTAIIGRELGLPTVVGVEGATARIPHGATLTIDGSTGAVRWQ